MRNPTAFFAGALVSEHRFLYNPNLFNIIKKKTIFSFITGYIPWVFLCWCLLWWLDYSSNSGYIISISSHGFHIFTIKNIDFLLFHPNKGIVIYLFFGYLMPPFLLWISACNWILSERTPCICHCHCCYSSCKNLSLTLTPTSNHLVFFFFFVLFPFFHLK